MNITKIRLIGLYTLDFPIVDAKQEDKYILKNADGLGPTAVDVSIKRTLQSGGFYQGRRPQLRQIVLTIGLNPDYAKGGTAGDLRTGLYGYITPGINDIVRVEFLEGETVRCFTTGHVSSMEPNPFSKDPQVQVSIDCLQSYLTAPLPLFVNPGGPGSHLIRNVGTAPVGFEMEVVFMGSGPEWSIFDAKGRRMTFRHSFVNGDRLEIDTRPGNRGVWLTRAFVRTNIIQALSRDSTWHMLYGGDNKFTSSGVAFAWGDVSFTPKYVGI